MMIYELHAQHDARQSFYGKAILIETTKKITLQSYETKILYYNKASKKIVFLCKDADAYTATTCRHVREFLKQYGDGNGNAKKSELLKMAGALCI